MSLPPRSPSPADARRGWGLSLAGAVTMLLVQPPADLWMLAWLAPLPWLALVSRPGVGPAWQATWTGGFCYWLGAIHWLRLPHPATSIGWVALSAYLAVYTPIFIWAARRLVHRWRWPLVLAAPVAWMACEQARGWFLGGFTLGGLGHTQWRWTTLIQCADALGAVGVSGVVMAVAAALAAAVSPWTEPKGVAPAPLRGLLLRSAAHAAAGGGMVAAALAYGGWRIAGEPRAEGEPLDVLLVQGSIDTELKHDPAAAEQVVRQYDQLTVAGLRDGRPDLVVWPETMWRWGLLEIDDDEPLPDDVVERAIGSASADDTPADRQARCRRALERERLDAVAAFARRYGTHWLVGIDKQVVTPRVPAGVQNYNCGLFLDAAGEPLGCYEKMHPVLFGEYVPLAERFPWLYRLTPLPAGLTAGTSPVAVTIAGHRVAVTICYETTLPGAVRSMMVELAAAGGRPDVIVNLTNDGWFWGSSELDMHLASGVFRAVEVRTPIVIAANTGFSAWIDGAGRLLARGPRRATATLRARVRPDGRTSPWLVWGALPTGICVAIVTLAVLEARLPGNRLENR